MVQQVDVLRDGVVCHVIRGLECNLERLGNTALRLTRKDEQRNV